MIEGAGNMDDANHPNTQDHSIEATGAEGQASPSSAATSDADALPQTQGEHASSLLAHIKAELENQQGSPEEDEKGNGKTRLSVDLSVEDILLLASLLESGQLDRGSKIGSAVAGAVRELTMIGHASLLQRYSGDGHWPVHVSFRDLSYSITAPSKDQGLVNIFSAMVSPFSKAANQTIEVNILDKVSGVFRAGSSTLVLGPPGCGVSTLFKILSGRITSQSGRSKITGELYYSGFSSDEVHVRKLSTYVDQNDNHIPVLTVRETLQFAFDCFGGAEMARAMVARVGLSGDASDHEIAKIHDELDNFPDFVIRNLALSNAADTIVGNELLRGVSGGEKRRVTSAEMMTGRRPLAFYDQISTGLDSAATFDICRRITGVAKRLDLTAVCALLQPPPETYELFDEVLILATGKVMFHGRRENVLPYFESIGYVCPENLDVADFIQEVTTSARTKHQVNPEAPSTEAELASAWLRSPFAQEKQDQVEQFCSRDAVYDSPVRREVYDASQPLYANSICKELQIVVKRQLTLAFRDTAFIQTRALQALIVGVFLGSIFFKMSPDLPTSISEDQQPVLQRYGIYFATMLHSALAGTAQTPIVLSQRPIYYKQSDAFFFRTSSYVIGELCSTLPLVFIECTLLAVTTFWIAWVVPFGEHSQTGESDVGGRFMLYWLLLIVSNICIGAWLRAVATFSPSQPVGQVLTGMCIAAISMFTGYIITADTIPVWFIWIFWLSPLSWLYRAGMITIFGSTAFTTEQRDYALELYGFEYDVNYLWSTFILAIGYTSVSMYVSYQCYEHLRFGGGGNLVLDKEEEEVAVARQSEILTAPAHINVPEEGSSPVYENPMHTSVTFTPVDLVFRDLWYSVPDAANPGATRKLLKGVSGFAESGTLTALMGSSGAGKTTLMDVLALRKTSGTITGDVFVNGRPQEKTTFSRIIGYVEQMDIHSPNATVEEALRFSAYLRQPSVVTHNEKDEFVENVVSTLQLGRIRNLMIGTKSSGGLTTEQAKRLTIGVELAANPAVIFADEPTSGLDASSARVVMDGLERIARDGRTVVCTIHQPSKSIFEKFDRLLLLRRGGEMVYFGDLGENSTHLLNYLDSLPGTRGMPSPSYNPATYMLEAIGANGGSSENDYHVMYMNGDLCKNNENRMADLIQSNLAERQEIQFSSRFASTFVEQTRQLTLRWTRSYWRDAAYNTSRIFVKVFIAVFFGFGFFKRGADITTTSDVQTFVGAVFQAIAFMALMALVSVLPVIYIERASYYRERAASYYAVSPVLIATTLAELPYCVATSLVFCSIFYFMVGMFHDAQAFFLFFAFYTIFYTCIVFFGHLLAQAFPNEQVATLVSAVFFALWCISAGLMISIAEVPYFWRWFTYLNPIRYSLQGLVSSQMGCDDPSIESALNPGCAFIEETNSTAWAVMQDRFGYSSTDWPWCLGSIIAFAGGLRIINGICYAYVSYLKR